MANFGLKFNELDRDIWLVDIPLLQVQLDFADFGVRDIFVTAIVRGNSCCDGETLCAAKSFIHGIMVFKDVHSYLVVI